MDVICNHFSKWKHTSMILTGLYMLKENGDINLLINDIRDQEYKYDSNIPGVELIIGDKRVFIDVADGYSDDEDMLRRLNDCDFYFIRSFDEEHNNRFGEYKKKIIPLGLNFTVYCKESSKLQTMPDNGIRYCLKMLSARLLKMRMMNEYYLEDFIVPPKKTSYEPKICFMTRLWSNERDESNLIDELNDMRICIMRRLRELYGNNFVGGMYDNDISRRMCPDLIVSPYLTNRYIYLKTMQQCDICVATTGLHKSIGGKFAEYIAASKGIVSERLNYFVPGLKQGENYIEFSDEESCVSAIDYLIGNPEILDKMKRVNRQYFLNYLSPDMQMKRVIDITDSY